MNGKTRKRRVAAFTLIELLVVVAIIGLLVSILLPSLRAARRSAKAVVCQSNMRQLSMGAFTYATEFGAYPPSLSNYAHAKDPAVKALRFEAGVDWLGIGDQGGAFVPGDPEDPDTGNPRGFSAAPKFGVLFPWVQAEEAYMCPEDKDGPLAPNTILGGGGNGKFSYTMFSMMGLRSPERIPPRLQDRQGPTRGGATLYRLPVPNLSQVPLFVEEHPQGINAKDNPNGHMEGNFNFSTDTVVSRHPGFTVRQGIDPRTGKLDSFEQGSTHIGFADGHVDPVKVNFGFGLSECRPKTAGGQGLDGIPYNAEGLLWFYGIEYQESGNIVPAG